MRIELLLQEITAVSQKYELIYQKTGGHFNLFEITNIASDEVTICRVLYELLSPNGSHYQGNLYLQAFITDVLQLEISEDELDSAKVFREYRIDGQRRIDLVIETKNRFIPIEVKIYAGDQKSQCFDYAQTARQSNVYYLTLFGDQPSEYSTHSSTGNCVRREEICCISFANDILNWLEHCVSQKETLKITSIREILLQFIDSIRTLTGQMENQKEMEIIDTLMKSSENMRSAIAIQSSVDPAKSLLMKKVLKAIEEKVGITKLDNEYDYAFHDFEKVKNFYKYKYSSCPGISYLYQSNVRPGIDIWVRMEINPYPFIGYCCPINGKAEHQPFSQDEIKSILKIEPYIDNWWAYWEYAPNDHENESPNFKHPNEPMIRLFDPLPFEQFVTAAADQIKTLLSR